MSLTLRFYLFAHDELRRLSKGVIDGLASGRDRLPQYAGTKQKVVEIVLNVEHGRPVEILRSEGSYLSFDTSGFAVEGLRLSASEALKTHADLEATKNVSGYLVDLNPRIRRQQWKRENRWELTKEDLDVITADIWGEPGSTKLGVAKGVASRRPPFTREAKYALSEIEEQIFKINMRLDQLSEQGLKSLTSRAREYARDGRTDSIWTGIAAAAEYRQQVKARHRQGKGKWFAVVEALRSHPGDDVRQLDCLAFQECDSQEAAEEAARRLLAENAKGFSQWTSVEAKLYCDLEWSPEDTEVYDWPIAKQPTSEDNDRDPF